MWAGREEVIQAYKKTFPETIQIIVKENENKSVLDPMLQLLTFYYSYSSSCTNNFWWINTLWEPLHGKKQGGRPLKTYIIRMVNETNIPRENIATVMENWNECVNAVDLVSR